MGGLWILGTLVQLSALFQFSSGRDLQITNVTSPSCGQLLVSWNSTSTLVSHFMTDLRIVNNTSTSSITSTVSASTRSRLIQGLRGAALYNITLRSYQPNGTLLETTWVQSQTGPCNPKITSFTKVDTSTYMIRWDSSNYNAIYSVSVRGQSTLWNYTSSSTSYTLESLPCGSMYMVSVVAFTAEGISLPSNSVSLETAPCCPANLSVVQLSQSTANVSWSTASGVQTYVPRLASPKQRVTCHTKEKYCLLGSIACGTSFSVSLEAVSKTGQTAQCTYHGYSSSACCPLGVKLFKLSNFGIRVTWRASATPANHTVNIYGTKGNFTCSPNNSASYCDVAKIPCGDVYTVVVSPVIGGNNHSSFCPQEIYSITCSGTFVGTVIEKGKKHLIK